MIDFSYFLTGTRHDQLVREAIEDIGIDVNHPLYSLVGSLSEHLLHARSDSTNTKYFHSFRKWEQFITEQHFVSFPASPIHVALYRVHILDSCSTYFSVSLAVCSIKCAHEMCGKLDHTNSAFVKNLVDSAK